MSWLTELKHALMIPEIIAERCVHTHCETAGCVRCVEACPQDAWLLDDESLKINVERCDGCGLCVAACTESALGQALLPALRTLDEKGTLLFACERVWEEATGEGVVPCLHSVSSSLLLEYYRNGYRQILSCRSNCETCPRYGGGDPFREQLARLNTLLANRRAPTIRHAQLTYAEWEENRKSLPTYAPQANHETTTASRRLFLRKAMTLAVEQSMSGASTIAPEDAEQPWPTKLPSSKGEPGKVLYPFVPQLDLNLCNGCDACVQLCPHEALHLNRTEDAESPAYLIQAERCTGCGICSDICDQQAIHIHTMQPQTQAAIPLVEANCKACGSHFHYPSLSQTSQTYCRICSHTNHHRNLFQVY